MPNLLLPHEVQKRVRLGRSSIYSRIAAGKFPRPVALGSKRRVAWIESEIDAWVRNLPRSDAGATREETPAED